jgi:hypothetical protein
LQPRIIGMLLVDIMVLNITREQILLQPRIIGMLLVDQIKKTKKSVSKTVAASYHQHVAL